MIQAHETLLQAPSVLDSGVYIGGVYYARIVYIHRSKRYKLYVTSITISITCSAIVRTYSVISDMVYL